MNEQPRFRVGQTVRVWYLCDEPFNATVLASWVQVDEPSLVELIEAANGREGFYHE